MSSFLDISIIFLIATAVAVLMQFLRLPLILGHIVSGILLGPTLLNVIDEGSGIQLFSELGVVALLFLVGMNLSATVLREVGKVAAITGVIQVVATFGLGWVIVQIFGFSPLEAAFLGLALALSSTIVVLKILGEKRHLGVLYGKLAIGILLVQDIIATIALIAISAAAKNGPVSLAIVVLLAKGVLVGALMWAIARYVLPSLTAFFAQSQEFLLLFTVAWGVGAASIFRIAGLTPELGALVAGVSLASSPYHFEISAKLKLLRDFFLVMFFIVVGASLTFANVTSVLYPIAVLSAFVLVVKPLIVTLTLREFDHTPKTSFLTGISMGQMSEFSLILLLLGQRLGIVSAPLLTIAAVVMMVTLACSSFSILYGETIDNWAAFLRKPFAERRRHSENEALETFEVILFGCHRLGSDFLSTLMRMKKNFLVVDFDPAVIQHLSAHGIPCRYGDAEDNEFLEELNLAEVRMIILTVPDFDATLFAVDKLRKKNKRAIVIASAHTAEQAQLLYDRRADYVVLPHFLGGNQAAMLIEKHGYKIAGFAGERKRHRAYLDKRGERG